MAKTEVEREGERPEKGILEDVCLAENLEGVRAVKSREVIPLGDLPCEPREEVVPAEIAGVLVRRNQPDKGLEALNGLGYAHVSNELGWVHA